MKKITTSLLALLFSLASLPVPGAAEEKAPAPPEVTALCTAFVKALAAGDEQALMACWHPMETVLELKRAEALKEANPAPAELEKFLGKERGRQVKRESDTKARLKVLREQIAAYFGDPSAIKFANVDLNADDQVNPTFEDVEVRFHTEKGALLEFEIEAAVKVGGQWRFVGRCDDEFSIELDAR